LDEIFIRQGMMSDKVGFVVGKKAGTVMKN
jgi:hypothetical protein